MILVAQIFRGRSDLFFNIFQCNLLLAGSTFLCFSPVCPNRDKEIRQKAEALTISLISLPLQIIPLLFRNFLRHCSPFSLISLEILWLMTRLTLVSLQLFVAMWLSKQVWEKTASLVNIENLGIFYPLLSPVVQVPGRLLKKYKETFPPSPVSSSYKINQKISLWTSLVVQCMWICLPMQGIWVRSLAPEDSTSLGATGPCAQLLRPCSRACEPQLLSPCAVPTEACAPRACAPQQEKPPQWQAHVPQWRIALAHHNERKHIHRKT